jgi:hypothetical protein
MLLLRCFVCVGWLSRFAPPRRGAIARHWRQIQRIWVKCGSRFQRFVFNQATCNGLLSEGPLSSESVKSLSILQSRRTVWGDGDWIRVRWSWRPIARHRQAVEQSSWQHHALSNRAEMGGTSGLCCRSWLAKALLSPAGPHAAEVAGMPATEW